MESYGLQVALGITEENMNKNVGLVPCVECAKDGVNGKEQIRCMGEEKEVNHPRKEKGNISLRTVDLWQFTSRNEKRTVLSDQKITASPKFKSLASYNEE